MDSESTHIPVIETPVIQAPALVPNGVPANPATGPMPDLAAAGDAEGIDTPTVPGQTSAPDPLDGDVGTKVSLGGRAYDVADLTLNELEEIESIIGRSFADMEWDRMSNMKLLVWMLRRRDTPDITLEDAGRTTLGELNTVKTAVNEVVAASRSDDASPSDPRGVAVASPTAASDAGPRPT